MQTVRKSDPRPRLPGTYVILYRLSAPVNNLVVGRLGTFDFSAGIYAYVGSAFGAGGIKARTDRHLSPDTTKMWNVDYFKPHAEPVEIWWTTDPAKRECAWAELVGGLPGASAPAPAFGARDCKKCVAHLYHLARQPSLDEFARQAGARLDGHAPIYCVRVGGTTPGGHSPPGVWRAGRSCSPPGRRYCTWSTRP